jgi:hypothetical protein
LAQIHTLVFLPLTTLGVGSLTFRGHPWLQSLNRKRYKNDPHNSTCSTPKCIAPVSRKYQSVAHRPHQGRYRKTLTTQLWPPAQRFPTYQYVQKIFFRCSLWSTLAPAVTNLLAQKL